MSDVKIDPVTGNATLLNVFHQDMGAFSLDEDVTEGLLEKLPKWLIVIPMALQWLWLAVIYRSLTLPSACNPALTAGGLVGEGKQEYFDIMGAHARSKTAHHTSVENLGSGNVDLVELAMERAGLSYPLILKPDIGWCGFGVRLVHKREELETYLAQYPRGERIILQRFVPDDGEAGIFYIRHPGASRGELLGMVLRYYPRVVGDGVKSIAQLIADNARLSRLGKNDRSQTCCDVSRIPARGEMVRVTTIGSTRVGGLYRDASGLITPALSEAIDRIARDMKDFHVARFDIRYQEIGALQQGEGLAIIEVNGAGSEAVHAWDPRFTLRQAFAIVFAKQRALFSIGHAMRKEGYRPIAMGKLARLYFRQLRLTKQYPPSN